MTPRFQTPSLHTAQITKSLVLRLAQAEDALQVHTHGQVDAILGRDGSTYLLRPAQDCLREDGNRARAVIESSSDVITVVNRGGVIVSQSHAAHRVLGYESGELTGRQIFDYVNDSDLAKVHSAFLAVVEGVRANALVQFRHLAPDGLYRMIEAAVSRLDGGAASSVVFSLRPVAQLLPEWNQTLGRERALAEESLAKDRLLAVIAHELRTPLTPVLLAVFELENDESLIESKPIFAMIRRNLELQSALINQLMSFVAIGQHKVRLKLEEVDAHEALRSVVAICQSDLDAAEMQVQLELGATTHWVEADSLRLQQVMWNLLKNAVKFSPPRASICISTSNDATGTITIEFADQGIGIDPDFLPLVFDSFRQGVRATQPTGGLGLGLFIAKGLAEAQRGTLTVASKGKGCGTSFRLKLFTTSTFADVGKDRSRA
jgi:two-component system CheB/CheR fusion protein